MSKKFCLVLFLVMAAVYPAGAYETDQFSNRLQFIEDSTALMNKRVTLAIADTITPWEGPRDQMKVVNGIFKRIGGRHWVDKLERYAMNSDEIERLDTPKHESIYRGHPFWATRVAGFYGVGGTLKINQTLVGTDKIGHFLSQGRKFYRRMLRMESESAAAEQSAFTERALFGQMSTGSYSNADLVANYEGYRFYRSLFEDGVVPGKPAILAWEDDHWKMQRPFDWADHVNDYWDEALNINHYDQLLYPHMKERFMTYCDDYRLAPDLYEVRDDEEALKQRYKHLQLRDTSELRLANLCREGPVVETATTASASRAR
ncbi:MAG: hypothetical protein PVJ71_07675 [Lysobacterales bacterium]|jgi:hypothetical protein